MATDYTKHTWVNMQDPAFDENTDPKLNAANLNEMEAGIDTAHSELATHEADADVHHAQTHAISHTNGTDDIQDATNAVKGLATAAQIAALEAVDTAVDQSVISGASPTFDGINITNVDADTLIVDVKEANVSAVTKGQMCAIVGSSGAKFEVQLCDCDDAALIRVLGLVVADTAQNETGQVIYKGLLTNVDSQIGNTDVNPNGETWLAGDLLFVSTTAGGLTNVRPSTGRCIKAGRTLKGNSASDTFLAIVNTNSICACAAAGEDICSRMGDNAGVNKHSFKDYANNEVAAIDSNGNLTLSGTVDGRDVGTDGTKIDNIGTIAELIQPATDTLTTAELKGTQISNYGQSAENTQTLPTAAEGLNSMLVIAAAGVGAVHLKAGATDKIYLDGVALDDGDKASLTAPAIGDYFTLFTFQNGASVYDWHVISGIGTLTDGGV